jgi:hypothetical protein
MVPVSTPIADLRPLSGFYEFEELKRKQWDCKFEELMRNRLVMGALRYGINGEAGKPRYNRGMSIIKRANLYLENGNLEHLVDIANEAMVEFNHPYHPKAHWEAQDDAPHHTEAFVE